MRIQLISENDAIVLTDNRLDNRANAWITLNGIDGLFGTPKPRETGIPIPQQDGSYWPSRLTGESRTVTIKCAMARFSTVAAAQFRDRICAFAYQPVTLLVEDTLGARTLTGWLADDPAPSMLLSLRAFTFTLIIYCPDPLKYGQPVTYTASGGVIRCQNPGTAATWPSVRISGHATSLALSYAGHRVQWRGDTQDLALDFRDMIPSAGTVTYDDAFQIPPGGATVSVAVAGGGAVLMIVRPAWR